MEAGTCRGGSAKRFAVNPSNLVITYDITDEDKRSPSGKRAAGRIDPLHNVIFKKLDCNLINPQWFSKVDVLFIDIEHNGHDEEKFLNSIEPYFKGILIMDDVDSKNRWPKLYNVFDNLKQQHFLLPVSIGSTRGTGVAAYGDWTIEIKEVEA